MKRHHIFILILLAISVAIVISATSSSGRYADFSEAIVHEKKEFTVVGNLNREKPILYNPAIDPNLVTFHMFDKEGVELKVILNQHKPQDMEKSEDIVVKGRFKDDAFYASTILLKCPSKYAEENNFGNQTSSIQ